MHTSLDQALGRNPRLNRVGQSLLNIASGASAAYSLRSLTGGDPNVVRVRRDSDNAERDFTASEVSSGELERWVNIQNTLPLDLRTLEADGRTGAIIDAKAAYSLRNLSSSYTGNVVQVRRNVDGSERDFTAAEVSDGTLTTWVNESFNDALPLDTSSGAEAAYSLRNLSSSYSGNVVEVRRSSDDTERDFTASEVSDGTLTDWVNTDVDKLNLQTETGSLVGNVSNETSTGFDFSVNNEGSTGFKNLLPGSQVTAGTYIATFDVVLNSGSLAGVSFRSNSPGEQTTLVVGSNSLTVNPDGTSNIYFRVEGTAVASVSITNITLTQTTADGHVKTWYDQSSNSNNATQTTAGNQPKIVEGGNYLGEIDFDGSNHYLDLTSAIGATTESAVFAVAESGGGTDNFIVDNRDAGGDGFRLFRGGSQLKFNWQAVTIANGTLSTDTKFIGFGNHSSSVLSVGVNGASTTSSDSNSVSVTATPRIGARSFTSPSGYWDGTMNEIIIYNSGHMGKRRAIEENIANHYGITLSSFSRDGFVKTWYDQSSTTGTANNNHATQSDSSKQPTIVLNGSLQQDADGNTAVKFDGTDDYLAKSDASPELFGPYTFFTHTDRDGDNGNPFSITGDADLSARYFAIYQNADTSQFNPRSNTSQTVSQTGLAGTDVRLTTVNTTSDTSYSVGTNGAAFTTGTTSYGTMPADPDGCPRIIIGKLREGATSAVQIFGGFITEIIAYAGTTNGDQSANRTALEANIGEYYGVTGIPAYDNTVNGFVETFYDQSGTNHAIQTSADAQPKIVGEVTAGQPHEFLGALVFDGTDDRLPMNSALNLDPFSILAVGPVQGATSPRLVGRQSSSNNGIALAIFPGNSIRLVSPTGNLTFSDGVSRTAGDVILASVFLGAGDTLTAFVDGATQSLSGTPDSNTALDIDQIGARQTAGFMSGELKELVIYPTDVSSNREALEANIAAANGITLS